MTNQHFDKQTVAKILVLFLISYGIMFFSSSFIYKWDSPMFFLPPIFGFFAIYFMIDWAADFFESKASHEWYFPVLLVVLALVAEYITLFWYYNWGSIAGFQQVNFDYVNELKTSAFTPFVLSVLFGWLSHLIIDKTMISAVPESKHKKKK